MDCKSIHNLLWIVDSLYPNLYLQVIGLMGTLHHKMILIVRFNPIVLSFLHIFDFLKMVETFHIIIIMQMPAASGYPPYPSTLHPSRCQPQQPVASRYPPPPSDSQASRYLPQQPVPLASVYFQSPEYSPQQPMPFPGYPPPRSSAYGSGYLPVNVPPTSLFQGK